MAKNGMVSVAPPFTSSPQRCRPHWAKELTGVSSHDAGLPPSYVNFSTLKCYFCTRFVTSDLALDVDPKAEVIKSAVITNIGGSGYFDTVVNMIDGEDMSCPSFEDTCVKEVRRACPCTSFSLYMKLFINKTNCASI